MLVGAITALLVVGATSCAGEDKKSASTVENRPTPATAAAADQAAPGAGEIALTGGATAPDPGSVALPDASPFGSALAIAASVTMQVADVRQAVIELPELVTAKGGAIFDSQISVGDPANATATITVKIPPADLESLIAGLGGLGELTGRTQQTEDVTDQLADLTSRIDNAQASVDRVRALLASATDLNDVIKIENELTIRETALEQLLGTQRNVSDRVQLATLTIVLSPADAVHTVAKHESRSVGGALRSGWHGFVAVVHGVVVALAYIAPLLALALLALLGMLIVRRMVGRRIEIADDR